MNNKFCYEIFSFKKISYPILFIFCTVLSANAQSNWTFQKYAEVTNSNGTVLFVLEYGVRSKGYDGEIKWKFTNDSEITVFDASIGDRVVTLTDGRSFSLPGQTIGDINSGQFKLTTGTDMLNYQDFWSSNKTGSKAQVSGIKFKDYTIKFAAENHGKKWDWSSAGTVNLTKN